MATILVVEDHDVTRRVLSYTLKKDGHTVITAENGLDALDQLAETAVDLAIVDIAMPKMNGIALLRNLRADDNYHNLPIVMLTASGDDEDRLIARDEGANDFLTKPASSRELTATVNRVLG